MSIMPKLRSLIWKISIVMLQKLIPWREESRLTLWTPIFSCAKQIMSLNKLLWLLSSPFRVSFLHHFALWCISQYLYMLWKIPDCSLLFYFCFLCETFSLQNHEETSLIYSSVARPLRLFSQQTLRCTILKHVLLLSFLCYSYSKVWFSKYVNSIVTCFTITCSCHFYLSEAQIKIMCICVS